MTVAYGDVPLIDPVTGRFPDAFAPPSVAAAVASTAQDAAAAEAARAAAEALTDVTVTSGAVVGNDLILTRTDATTVNAGNVRGATGPANTLTIGTVTTLPAGSSATASFTGAAPNQSLSLGLPNGQPSDWFKVGPGDPRTPASTAGAITGAEANGVTYVSTDGGGVGGYRWVKRAGTWVCTEGNTGWVNVPLAKLINGWTYFGADTIRVCRVAGAIEYQLPNLGLRGTSATSDLFLTMPAGWRLLHDAPWYHSPGIMVNETGGVKSLSPLTKENFSLGTPGRGLISGVARSMNNEAWPTSLTY